MSEDKEILDRILSNDRLLARVKELIEHKDASYKSNDELIEFWIDKMAYSKGVKKNYGHKIKFFLTYLSSVDDKDWNLQDVMAADIEAYKIYLERTPGLSLKTKVLYFAILKSFYDFYEKQAKRANIWKFKEFPCFAKLLVNPGERDVENQEKKIVILTPGEAKLYLKRLFRLDKEFYLLERFQYESGLRFIDVARIQKKFLRLKGRHVFTEGRRGFRCYFLSQELVDHVEEFLLHKHDKYLFEFKGKEIQYATYMNRLKRVVKFMDLSRNLSAKSGRKTFSTNRFKVMGQSKPEISVLLGHQIKDVTDRYIQLEITDYLDKFDKFNYLTSIF